MFCPSGLAGDEIHGRVCHGAQDRCRESWRLVLERAAGHNLADGLIDLLERFGAELLALVGDAIGHAKLGHGFVLERMRRAPTDHGIPDVAPGPPETPSLSTSPYHPT